MKYLHLVWAALFRRKTRTLFTLLLLWLLLQLCVSPPTFATTATTTAVHTSSLPFPGHCFVCIHPVLLIKAVQDYDSYLVHIDYFEIL